MHTRTSISDVDTGYFEGIVVRLFILQGLA